MHNLLFSKQEVINIRDKENKKTIDAILDDLIRANENIDELNRSSKNTRVNLIRERDQREKRVKELENAWNEMRESILNSDNDDQGMDGDKVNYVLGIIDDFYPQDHPF